MTFTCFSKSVWGSSNLGKCKTTSLTSFFSCTKEKYYYYKRMKLVFLAPPQEKLGDMKCKRATVSHEKDNGKYIIRKLFIIELLNVESVIILRYK